MAKKNINDDLKLQAFPEEITEEGEFLSRKMFRQGMDVDEMSDVYLHRPVRWHRRLPHRVQELRRQVRLFVGI